MFYYHDAAADEAVPFDLSSDSNGFGIVIPRQKMGNKTTPLKAGLVILSIKNSDFDHQSAFYHQHIGLQGQNKQMLYNHQFIDMYNNICKLLWLPTALTLATRQMTEHFKLST